MHRGIRIVLSAGLLALSTGTSLAAHIFELEGGVLVTVDSSWEDGDRLHLSRGGVDLIVPKDTVCKMETLPDEPAVAAAFPAALPSAPPAVGRATLTEVAVAAPEPTPDSLPTTDDLARQERATSRHLLRVQREKFEATARGESPRKLARLAREFERTQKRRHGLLRDLDRLAPVEN
jgi:hypothetical protein